MPGLDLGCWSPSTNRTCASRWNEMLLVLWDALSDHVDQTPASTWRRRGGLARTTCRT
jgi:hypothetical protein